MVESSLKPLSCVSHKRTASTKVIDAEFAYVGPMSFDVGQYLAHLIIPSIALAVTSSSEKHEYLHYLSLQVSFQQLNIYVNLEYCVVVVWWW